MQKIMVILFLLWSGTVHAQDGEMTGIDAYFMEDGFYDNLMDAVADSDNALYLDLSLQSPKLRDIPADVFKLKKLKYLELGFNQVASVADGIAQLTELEVLGLDGNKYLKTISAKVFQLPRLKELHLKDTGLSDEQLKVIRSRLPEKCKIFM